MENDLISRQAAIRLVKTECNPYGKPSLEYESGKKVIEYLKTMPSAQPEIIHCKDCKFFEELHDGVGYCERDKNSDDLYHVVLGVVDGDWFCADGKERE